MSAGFAKYKRNNDGDLIARYNGKVIGKWYEAEGEGYVYSIDTGPSPIVREDIQKKINEYTVKEMAVRRLKKEKQLQEAAAPRSKEYNQGIAAAKAGKKEKDNPYDWQHPKTKLAYLEWHNGFRKGKQK